MLYDDHQNLALLLIGIRRNGNSSIKRNYPRSEERLPNVNDWRNLVIFNLDASW